MTTSSIITEEKGAVAYSPTINLVRPILAKYLSEWQSPMLMELAELLSSEIKLAVEKREGEVEGMKKEVKPHN